MRFLYGILAGLLFMLEGWQRAQPVAPVITFPQSGEAVQGIVTIQGSSAVEGFLSYEVAFTYAANAPETWFVIAVGQQSVEAGVLASWDTTKITDGNYTLRLRVYRTDGGYQDAVSRGVRVRNYTPVETATPIPQPTATPTELPPTPILPTPTVTPFPPTPTPLPPNPASLSRQGVQASAGWGAVLTLLAVTIFGAAFCFRRQR